MRDVQSLASTPDSRSRHAADDTRPVTASRCIRSHGKEDDPYDLLFSNAAALHRGNVKFAIRTGGTHNARHLPYQAAACAAFGLPKEEALRAVTINAAEIFGVADRIGSLEPGKIANVIVTDGDPLEIRTNLVRLFIGGEDIALQSYHTLQYDKFSRRP